MLKKDDSNFKRPVWLALYTTLGMTVVGETSVRLASHVKPQLAILFWLGGLLMRGIGIFGCVASLIWWFVGAFISVARNSPRGTQMLTSITKVLKTQRWIIVAFAISAINVLAETNAMDDPIPPGWSSLHKFINDFWLLIAGLTMMPLGIPREYILAFAAERFKVPVWFGMAGYSDSKRVLLTFLGDVVVCYLYFVLFWTVRWIWRRFIRRTQLGGAVEDVSFKFKNQQRSPFHPVRIMSMWYGSIILGAGTAILTTGFIFLGDAIKMGEAAEDIIYFTVYILSLVFLVYLSVQNKWTAVPSRIVGWFAGYFCISEIVPLLWPSK